MSKFKVTILHKGDLKAPKPPADKREIHPGLQQIATSLRCLRCEVIFDMEPTCQEIPMIGFALRVGWCECGVWLQKKAFDPLRWMRFACGPVYPNSGAITTDGTYQFTEKISV
jgi:hypothetical protein